MDNAKAYIDLNRSSWNNRVAAHLKSDFYHVADFLSGESSLNPIELDLLGDISGKSVLHLQCHFGQDSISLSRLGAQVTGVDLADQAIETANELALATKSTAKFICCDIYELPKYLDEQFDIVFTSYGTIMWLPDLDRWANLIAAFLKPGGSFVFAEFHPVVWMFDDGFEKINYSYFNSGPIIETEHGTYADKNAEISSTTVTWNHSIAEVSNALIQHGLSIALLQEFDYSPYNCFNHAVAFEPNKYRIAHLENKIPMVYTIKALKK